MDKSPHIHLCIEAKNKKASVFDRGFFIFIGAREMNPKPSNRALMASPNSPTRGHPKFPQAAQPNYDVSGLMAKRAAASLSL